MIRQRIKPGSIKPQYDNVFLGESIEEKIRTATQTKQPIEAVSPMIYTERKDGVKKEHDIRADKWDIAQTAMDSIAVGRREKREERIKGKEPAKAAADKPTE